MNEDNKNLENGTNENDAAKLNEELENLRDTFQEKLDETVKEAENAPEIQELEYGEEMIEDDEETEEENASSEKANTKKAKKKRKPAKVIAITVPIVLLVLIVGVLLTYVVASVTNPNFSSFVSSYVQSTSAEEYDDKISYLEKAASYCSDNDSLVWKAMKKVVLEDIVVAIYNEKGFEEAYSYITENMSEDDLTSSSNKAFKKILKVKKSVDELSKDLVDKVIKNTGDAAEVPDIAVLCEGINIPDDVKDTLEGVIKTLSTGIIFNRSSEDIKDSLTSVTSYYTSVYNALVAFGADKNELAQNIAVDLYNNGYVFEAAAFSYLYVKTNDTTEGETGSETNSVTLSEEFSAIKTEFDKFSEFNFNAISIAKSAAEQEKTSDEEIISAVKAAVDTDETKTKILTDLVKCALDAVKSEDAHNFTKASNAYSAVLSAQSVLGMDTAASYLQICKLLVTSGDINSLQTVVEEYFTDEAVAAFTESEKADYDNIKELLDAFNNVYDVYAKLMQSTDKEVTFDNAKKELEAIITDGTSDYVKGFVNYFTYGAAIGLDENVNAISYLSKTAEYLPNMPFLYGGIFIDEYISDKNYSAAADYAKKLLEIDVSYEYANYVVAFCKRVNGDIDGAIAAALVGIDVADSKSGCGLEAAIGYLLKDDFESAFNYISMAYSANSPSVELYDLILIFNALYDGDNEEIKAELDNMVSVVNQTYTYNSVSSYDDTKAIIAGEKTLKDVFQGGNYLLSDD